ncbi:MAG: tetratricopeptide repeat protein [Flavobacterium sp.]|nr:tetratricopeptide repeat protein [Flavobacterium sp.]
MRKIILILTLLITSIVFSQDQLAQNYFDKGDFEKAIISYDELLKNQPSNSNYFQKLVECMQQLKQLDKAEIVVKERLDKYKQSNLLVELGYNYRLKKDESNAKKYFDQAIDKIRKIPTEIYGIANVFEKKIVLDYALLAYKTASQLDPKMNFNYQIALLYGQTGNTDLMIETFLSESFTNPNMLLSIQNQLSRFIADDTGDTFKTQLKKALLLRSQQSQDVFWNQYLSWYFVQQKEFGKAFIQEKSIYKRNPESFFNIVNLAQLSIEENDSETANEIYAFILENTLDQELKIKANYYIQKLKIDKSTAIDYPIIKLELENLIKQFGISPYSLSLQKLQAHFTAFQLNNPEGGKTIMKTSLDLPLNQYQIADIKMEMADILLFQERFNQATILYSQIEDDLKGDAIGHEASMKIAKTSYFQTDFVWATKQLKTLKSASTQLIANDAIDLFLIINDNTVADSTQVALKKFAHADFLLYQNKPNEALAEFQKILIDFKGKEIEPITLYRVGKIYEKQGDSILALTNYQMIIDGFKECIYIDEANYFAAEIYNKQLKNLEKAKKYYEEIIFKHEDSIYFTEARRKYRAIRGDKEVAP